MLLDGNKMIIGRRLTWRVGNGRRCVVCRGFRMVMELIGGGRVGSSCFFVNLFLLFCDEAVTSQFETRTGAL